MPAVARRTQLDVLRALRGHMIAEETNELDVVMATVSKSPRYVTAEAGEDVRTYDDTDQVEIFYTDLLGSRDVIGSLFTRRLTGDWYIFAEAYTSFRYKGDLDGTDRTGLEFYQPILAFIPVGENGSIKGEFLHTRDTFQDAARWALEGREARDTSFRGMREVVENHDRLVAAVSSGDADGFPAVWSADATAVTRDLGSADGALARWNGRDAIAAGAAAVLPAVSDLAVVNVVASDWYVFAEYDLTFAVDGSTTPWRSAAIYGVDERGAFSSCVGYASRTGEDS